MNWIQPYRRGPGGPLGTCSGPATSRRPSRRSSSVAVETAVRTAISTAVSTASIRDSHTLFRHSRLGSQSTTYEGSYEPRRTRVEFFHTTTGYNHTTTILQPHTTTHTTTPLPCSFVTKCNFHIFNNKNTYILSSRTSKLQICYKTAEK